MTTYEISVWEDYYNESDHRYCERRLAIIGQSNMHNSGIRMDAQCRARDPKLVNNVNGTNTFTFTMYYSYISNDTGEIEYNPYVPLLINERKIKVFWRDKWYDFVIKDMKKSSDKKTITYTCKDLFINELSKNGYNIEFADELQNNMGTAPKLAEKIVADTDWQVSAESDIIEELREEAVYEITTENEVIVQTHNEINGGHTFTIEQGKQCLLFYSTVQNRDSFLQFIYYDEEEPQTENDSILVTNGQAINIEEVQYNETNEIIEISVKQQGIGEVNDIVLFSLPGDALVSQNYRANRTVFTQLATIDPILNKTVDLFESALYYGGTLDSQLKLYTPLDATNERTRTAMRGLDDFGIYYFNGQGYARLESTTPLYHYNELNQLESITNCRIRFQSERISNIWLDYDGGSVILNGNLKDYFLSNKGGTLYKYTHIEFDDYTTVQNIVVNPTKYTNIKGWWGNTTTGAMNPTWEVKNPGQTSISTYLKFNYTNGAAYSILNMGLENNFNCLNGTVNEGDLFRFRLKGSNLGTNAKPRIAQYIDNNGQYKIDPDGIDYFSFNKISDEDGYQVWHGLCTQSFTIDEIRQSLNLGIFIEGTATGTIELYDVQFYRLVEYKDETEATIYVNPGDVDKSSLIKKTSYFYYPQDSKEKIEDIKTVCKYTYYPDSGLDPISTYERTLVPKTNYDSVANKYARVRSIKASGSNRYNLLQTLAETFQCWVRFEIEHEENGAIVYRDGRYQKNIVFKKEVGGDTGIIFSKGIDLKSLSQNYNSDQLVTKVYVKPNEISVAENGICTIQRATENPSRANFILNFDYYMQQGLMDRDQVNTDLYDETDGYITKLYSLNTKYDEVYKQYSDTQMLKLKLEANYKVYNEKLLAAREEEKEKKDEYKQLTGFDWGALDSTSGEYHPTDDELNGPGGEKIKAIVGAMIDIQGTIAECERLIIGNETTPGTYTEAIEQYTTTITECEDQLQDLIGYINEADSAFWNKYSRFIQEGTWNSSDYYDDNLYYLAAENVLRTSSRPQFKFDINVISLESLDEFKLKKAHVGDIGYVEDVEFLGMTPDNLQPRRERVLISETTFNLDSPQKDAIKVQNYKTRFEDLFQRITASTESLKAQEGSFARTASQFSDDGSLKLQVLQEALTKGSSSLNFASTNDCVVKDETGITVVDTINRGNQLKVTSGGILMTEDGRNWTKVVGAQGVRPEALREGSIQADEITIMNKNNGSIGFRWTGEGIGAYTNISAPDNNFVKMNQEGITMASGSSALSLPSNPTWNDYLTNDDIKVRIDRATGNVKVKGDIYADNGYFNGVVNATGGIFKNVNVGSLLLFNLTTYITTVQNIIYDSYSLIGLQFEDNEAIQDLDSLLIIDENGQQVGDIIYGCWKEIDDVMYYLILPSAIELVSGYRAINLGSQCKTLTVSSPGPYSGQATYLINYIDFLYFNKLPDASSSYSGVKSVFIPNKELYLPLGVGRWSYFKISDGTAGGFGYRIIGCYSNGNTSYGTQTIGDGYISSNTHMILMGINGTDIDGFIPKRSLYYYSYETLEHLELSIDNNEPLFQLKASLNSLALEGTVIDCGSWDD